MSKWQKKEEVLSHIGGKVLIFGNSFTGKSTVAGTFPRINLLDSEDGQTYYIAENENILNVMRTVSASETQEALNELNDEEFISEFDSVVIDSGTKLYENMQAAAYEVVEDRAAIQKRKGKDINVDDLALSVRDWGHIKRWNQQLKTSYILLSSLGKWIVEVAHQKDINRDATPDEKKRGIDRVKIGETADLAKKAEYDFDIIIQTYIEEAKDGSIRYFGKIIKDRTKVTKKGDILENPSFETWRSKWESTRKYGNENVVDLSSSIKKDVEKMKIDDNKLDNVKKEFKTLMKQLDKSKQASVMKKCQEYEITNPLTCEDLSIMEEMLKFIKSL